MDAHRQRGASQRQMPQAAWGSRPPAGAVQANMAGRSTPRGRLRVVADGRRRAFAGRGVVLTAVLIAGFAGPALFLQAAGPDEPTEPDPARKERGEALPAAGKPKTVIVDATHPRQAPEVSPVRFVLKADRDAYPQHERILLTATVTNTSEQEVWVHPPIWTVLSGTLRSPRSMALFGGRDAAGTQGKPTVLKPGQSVSATHVLEFSKVGNYYIDAEFKGLVHPAGVSQRFRAKRVRFRVVEQAAGYKERVRLKIGRLLAKFDEEFRARPHWGGRNGTLQDDVASMGPDVAPYLITAIKASSNNLRRTLLYRPLVSVASPKAVGFFKDRLLRGDAGERTVACKGLQQICRRGAGRQEALTALLTALRQPEASVRRKALSTLATIEDKRVKEAMGTVLDDRDEAVRLGAARYLAASEWAPLREWLARASNEPTRARYLAARDIVAELQRRWEVQNGTLPACSWDQAARDPKTMAEYRKVLDAWNEWAGRMLPDSHDFFREDRKHWPKRDGTPTAPIQTTLAPHAVLRRTIADIRTAGRCLLDLETGRLVPAPSDLWPNGTVERAWCQKNGVDLSIVLGQFRDGRPTVAVVCGANAGVLPVGNELWTKDDGTLVDDAWNDAMHHRLTSQPFVVVAARSQLPVSLLVATRGNRLALLQVLSLGKDRPEVTVRYRMIGTKEGGLLPKLAGLLRGHAGRLSEALPEDQRCTAGRLAILDSELSKVFASFAARGGFPDMRPQDAWFGHVDLFTRVTSDLRVQMLAAVGRGSSSCRSEVLRQALGPIRSYVLEQDADARTWQDHCDGMLVLLAALGYPDALDHVVSAYHLDQAKRGNPVTALPGTRRWIPHDRGHNRFFMLYMDQALVRSARCRALPVSARRVAAEYAASRQRAETRRFSIGTQTYEHANSLQCHTHDVAYELGLYWSEVSRLKAVLSGAGGRTQPAGEAERRRAYEDLGAADGHAALAAMRVLARGGAAALAILADRLRPLQLTPAEMERLVSQLSSKSYKARAAAYERLLAAGQLAVPILRATGQSELSAEARSAIRSLLSQCEGGHHARRAARTVYMLELAASPRALQILRYLTREPFSAETRRLATEAVAAGTSHSSSTGGAGGPVTGRPVARFDDVTKRLGLDGLPNAAAAWVDYNNDGWVDLYVDGQLWRNDAGKGFTKMGKLPLEGTGIWGDFDNDGFRDLFCWPPAGKLYRNLGGREFEDVSGRLPNLPMKVSRGATWVDLNGDGLLDLYVGGYEGARRAPQPDAICINNGKGGFALAWQTRGRPWPARGVTAADYDEDGDVNLYVSHYRLAPNLLIRNDGKGGFEDVAAESGVAGDGGRGAWGHTIGSAWGDLDEDGHLDLFVGNFSHPPAWQDRPQFLRSLGPKGQWRFEDKTKTAGLGWQESYASPALGDFDNDGRLDLFFSTVYKGDHCVLYRNEGGWRFRDVTGRSGVSAALSYQAAWADFDNDGDLDLLTGGRLWRNELRGGHWLHVALAGDGRTISRDALGAQVRIPLGDRVLTRQVESATGEGNQSDRRLHFGLGSQQAPVKVLIRWPDGTSQALTTEINRAVQVRYCPRPPDGSAP